MKTSEEKAEATLRALDGIARAQAPEDLETRLLQRLQFTPQWVKWLRYSVAALLIIGLLNVLTVLSLGSEVSPAEATNYLDSELLTDSAYPVLTITEE